MTVLSFISLYLSVGLSIALMYVILQHLIKGETASATSVLACTLFWPDVISSFIYNINN